MKPIEKLSVVIPVCNEAENVEELLRQVHAAARSLSLARGYEILVVDDGSDDGTLDRLYKIQAEDRALTVIALRGNFGKSAALMAGFEHVSGDVVVTMDGDLQDDPKEIPRFLEELGKGYDLVSGWKQHRQDPWEKRVASKQFNRLASLMTGIRLRDFNCGFKAYRSWCLKDLRLTGNLYRFIPVFVHRLGGKILEIPVEHRPRVHGKSKYGFRRYFQGAADLCTILLISKFFQKPLYFFAAIGVPILLLGFVLGLYLLGGHIYWLWSGDIRFQLNSRPLLVISVTLFGIGLQIFLIGLLAELIVSRTSSERSYSIKEIRPADRQ